MTLLLAVWAVATAQVIDAPQMDEAERQRTAKVLLDEGLKRYEAKEYDRAVESFKAAYALAPAPGLLYNMAQAYRLSGKHCAEAARTYRAYLQADPNATNRDRVEQHLKALEACAPDDDPKLPGSAELAPRPPDPKPAAAALPPPVVEQRPRRALWPPLATVLGGAAVLGLGAVFYAWAGSDYQGYLAQCGAGQCAPEVWRPSQLKEQVGIAMLGIGGAAMLAAAMWFLIRTAGGDT